MKNYIKACTLLLSLSSLTGCMAAMTGQGQDIQATIDKQNYMIEQLSAQVSSVQPAQADTYMQIQNMTQEIAILRGKVDDLEYRLQNVDINQMQTKLAEHDRALHAAQTQLGVELQLDGTPISAPSPVSAPISASGQAISGIDSVLTADPLGGVQLPTVVTTGAGSKKGEDNDTAQLLYDAGISAFNERKYKNALKSFTDFEKVYKEHVLTSNAIFWQGECQYQLQNYPAAALAYEKVISGYPNSNKAPSSYLKQGMTFSLLDKKDAAKERYIQLIETYPKAPEASRAKSYLENLEKNAS